MKKIFILSALPLLIPSLLIADHAHDLARAEQAYAAGDYGSAYHFWLSEAEHGDAEAQEMVAAMNARGKGVPQSHELAAEWYQKSAEQGNGSAQYSLGELYFKGLGVAQSIEQAYAWWLIAGTNGVDAATKKRKELAGTMTQSEIDKAQDITIQLMLMISD